METPSEENQDQRQDKRGTNERLQRPSSVLFTAVFTGVLTFSSLLGFSPHNSWVAFAQWGIFRCQNSILVLTSARTKLLISFTHHYLCKTGVAVTHQLSAVRCLCVFYDLISLRLWDAFSRPHSCSRRDVTLPPVIIVVVSLLRTMSLLQSQQPINQTSGCVSVVLSRGTDD